MLSQAAANETLSEVPASGISAASEGSSRPEEVEVLPPVLAAAVSAVERYGWHAVHEGKSEWTALHWAAIEGRSAVCMRLLQHRADPLQPDNVGRTALDYAKEAGHADTWKLLNESIQVPVAASSAAAQGPSAYPMSLRMPPREVRR
ncbi:unnamed protein product [Polarella glacialis]|nr:unnamed protein product [Polarella glacialis]